MMRDEVELLDERIEDLTARVAALEAAAAPFVRAATVPGFDTLPAYGLVQIDTLRELGRWNCGDLRVSDFLRLRDVYQGKAP